MALGSVLFPPVHIYRRHRLSCRKKERPSGIGRLSTVLLQHGAEVHQQGVSEKPCIASGHVRSAAQTKAVSRAPSPLLHMYEHEDIRAAIK